MTVTANLAEQTWIDRYEIEMHTFSPGLTHLYIWLFDLTLMTLKSPFSWLEEVPSLFQLFVHHFRRVLVVYKVEVSCRHPPS